MTTVEDEAKEIVRRYIEESMNERKSALITELMSSDYCDGITKQHVGAESYQEGIVHMLEAFPDLHIIIEAMIAEGDTVAVHATFHGTHKNKFYGWDPTGEKVSWQGTVFRRVENGKIVEGWGTIDWLGIVASAH